MTDQSTQSLLRGTFLLSLVCALVVFGGCDEANPPSTSNDTYYFESANPTRTATSTLTNINTTTNTSTDTGVNGGDEPQRAIEEADIIQIDGNRLYALSPKGGLSVVDVADPDNLHLLGRYAAAGTPFEMYVRGHVVLVMYSAWSHEVEQGDTVSSHQTSAVLALDVASPSNIRLIDQFALPGSVQDSRIVGDILYVIAHQNARCWDCDSQANNYVVSLDLSDEDSIEEVDRLSVADSGYSFSGQPRAVMATADRIYIGGPYYWNDGGASTSTIQVVDISISSGELTLGTTISTAGAITSRWQMDEQNGVLRVISQPWNVNLAGPSVETFEVVSSQEIEPLGTTTLTLPRPEELMAARFDGDRAYAITFERTDPLFTLDLSDPANPRQVGELEMPGP